MQPSAEILDCTSLEPGARVELETKSRHYAIEFLGGDLVRISGHPQYCPQPVMAHLQGSLNRQGLLEAGLIERGMRLMFVVEDRLPVTTSKVLHFHVDHDAPPRVH